MSVLRWMQTFAKFSQIWLSLVKNPFSLVFFLFPDFFSFWKHSERDETRYTFAYTQAMIQTQG